MREESFFGYGVETFYGVCPSDDGGFVAVGTSNSDDGYIAAGESESSDGGMEGLSKGNRDAVIVKYDISGRQLWKKSFGGILYDSITGLF